MGIRRVLGVAVIAALAFGIDRSTAQEPKGNPPKQAADEKFAKFDYENVSLRSIIQDMAKRSGVAATFDKNVDIRELDRKVTLSMFASTAHYAALRTCEALDLTVVLGDKGWRVANPIKGKIHYEEVPFKQALEDLAKQAGTTVSFKNVSDKTLSAKVICWAHAPRDLALWARIICDDEGVTITIRDSDWTVAPGVVDKSGAQVLLSEERVQGRWLAVIRQVDVSTALMMIAKATKTELDVADERTVTKDAQTLADRKIRALLDDYASPDYLIREVARQAGAGFIVRFVPGDTKKPHRYEVQWV